MQINVGTTPGQAAEAIIDVDSFGNALNNIPTYRTGIYDLTPAANATDVFTISGSATKTIKITKLQVTADSASTAGVIDFYCFLSLLQMQVELLQLLLLLNMTQIMLLQLRQ